MEQTMGTCLQGLASRGFRPGHVVDVGASSGPWTKMALGHWPKAHFTLFEPLAEHAAALNDLSRGNANVAYFPCALGAEKSKLALSVVPGRLDESSLAYPGPDSREVDVECLDQLLASGQVAPAELMKIDVQGFERHVLRGATKFIEKLEVLITETYFYRFSPRMTLFHEMVEIMDTKGFRVYEVVDQLRRARDQAVAQCDLCFVREGHPLLNSDSWE